MTTPAEPRGPSFAPKGEDEAPGGAPDRGGAERRAPVGPESPEAWPELADLYNEGYAARRSMLPMELCPWLLGESEEVDLLGDPDYHDVVQWNEIDFASEDSGETAGCPWCQGWRDAERELFREIVGRDPNETRRSET